MRFTLHISPFLVQLLTRLVRGGHYISGSAAVRRAVCNLLLQEFAHDQKICEEIHVELWAIPGRASWGSYTASERLLNPDVGRPMLDHPKKEGDRS